MRTCSSTPPARLDGPLRFHDLRHHFASWYVMRGGSLPSLQQALGHATRAMTMRYSHLSPKHLRDEMAKTEAGRVTGGHVFVTQFTAGHG